MELFRSAGRRFWPVAALIVLLLAGAPAEGQTQTPAPTPVPGAGIVFDGRDRSLCRTEPGAISLQGTVSLPPGQEAILVTSWHVVNPADRASAPVAQERGPVRDGQRFTVEAGWPGIRPGDTIVQIHAGAVLLDPQTRTPLMPRGATRSIYWYPWVCQPFGIGGAVALRPIERVVTPPPPQQYALILDFSGSMSTNFLGQALIDGRVRQCALGPDPALNALFEQDRPICRAAADPAWQPAEQRRLAVQKRAAKAFVEQLGPQDQVALIRMTGAGIADTPLTLTDAAGKALLLQAIDQLSAAPGDPLLGRGGTPAASALLRARRIFASPDTPAQSPDGRDYRRNAVLLIDSVTDHYRDQSNGRYLIDGAPGPLVGWFNTAEDQPHCDDPADRVDCNIGYASTTLGPIARPVTAMANEGYALQTSAQVFVLPLAGVDETGLDSTASAPAAPWFQPAPAPELLAPALALVAQQGRDSTCALVLGTWIERINAAHLPDPAALPGVSPAVVGEITLTPRAGTPIRLPVRRDQQSGALSYEAEGVAPGDYLLSGWVGYKGNDGVTRRYDLITDRASGRGDSSVAVIIPPGSTPSARRDLALSTRADVCD